MDCEQYETYTVKVDSRGAASNSSVCWIHQYPITNVVKAELLSASIASNAASSAVFYIYVDELVSKFNDKADVQTVISVAGTTSNIGPNPSSTPSNVYQLRTSIACVPAEQVNNRTIFTRSGYWDADVKFIEPIRQVQHLTVSVLKDDGVPATLAGSTFMNLRFTCARPNVCKY
jgi:hypothetical protein